MVEDCGATDLDLVHEGAESIGSLNLHDGLASVNRHQKDAEEASTHRGGKSLDCRGEIHVLKGSEDSSVGCSISESGEWALNECWCKSLIETRNTSL